MSNSDIITILEWLRLISAIIGVGISTWGVQTAFKDRAKQRAEPEDSPSKQRDLMTTACMLVRHQLLRLDIQMLFLSVAISVLQLPSNPASSDIRIIVFNFVYSAVAVLITVVAITDRTDRWAFNRGPSERRLSEHG